MSDDCITQEFLNTTLIHTAPPGYFRESVGDGFDHDNVAHLLEALYRDEPLHGTAMQALDGTHRYNWLDCRGCVGTRTASSFPSPPRWLFDTPPFRR